MIKIFILIIFIQKLLSADIEYYSDGINKIDIYNLKKIVDWQVQLKGKSKYKYLLFQIEKLDDYGYVKNEREIKTYIEEENFNFIYYLKDGKGKYKFTIFGNNTGELDYAGLYYFTIYSKADIPYEVKKLNLNEKILSYIKNVIGKQVGRGECWDLAAETLDYFSADWKRPKIFGIELELNKDEILPGDIIQMYNLRLEYENKIEYFGIPEHTAIVYEVLDKSNFKIAHQNVAGKRYVIISDFNTKYIKSGSMKFYRPIQGFIKK